ncbi:universal stress protein [Rhodobacteraceae bacterium D3-12]|nr:universal stress protein [Rhodobacteraceae bacterium D3-12]
MFSNIMVPVDLAHIDDLRRALDCAGDLARHYDAKITFVGVTAAAPSATAHDPKEFQQKLTAFADKEGATFGVTTKAHTVISHDPATDLDNALLKATKETGADLVVMASHLPALKDYLWPSNGGKVAAHAACTVMVVRG